VKDGSVDDGNSQAATTWSNGDTCKAFLESAKTMMLNPPSCEQAKQMIATQKNAAPGQGGAGAAAPPQAR